MRLTEEISLCDKTADRKTITVNLSYVYILHCVLNKTIIIIILLITIVVLAHARIL